MSAYAAGQDTANTLADAGAVRLWADKVLAEGAGAARRDQLAALALTLAALNEVSRFGANPPADVYQQAIVRATSDAQIAPPVDDREASAIRAIYDEVIHYATTLAPNTEQAADALTARAGVTGPSPADQALLRTVCREERDRLTGDALLATGDAAAAQTSYESALAANPRHAPALIGLSAARERQDDVAGAITHATKATEIAPDSPAAWLALAVTRLAAGNTPERDAALDHFLALVSEQPEQVRMANLREGIATVRDLLDRRPDLAAAVKDVIPRFRAALDARPDDGGYQLAARYAELGSLALTADDAATAEPLLRRSLELDARQAFALTDLAVSVLVQGRDSSAETAAALSEPDNPLWTQAGIEKLTLLTRMKDRLDAYTTRFPDRAQLLSPLINPVASAVAELAPPEVPPKIDPNAETYESTIFGFKLTMTEGWSIIQSFPQEGTDGVLVGNGVSLIIVAVSEMPGVTPAQCVEQYSDSVTSGADITDVRPLTDADGAEIRSDAPDLAFAAYRYTYGQDDGMAPDRVLYTSCQPFPAPDALLFIQQLMPAEQYDEQTAAREALIATFTLPQP
jgi:tetratricopeptide (TPR) repeat protein